MIDYHRELLADETRTTTYREAIRQAVRPGDVVLDLGCGSGILSFFACQAGASRVFAIERGKMAGVAEFLARHLGFDDRVTILNGESTELELPQRADVLVTETIGPACFDENILGFLLDARQRHLRDGARIIPRELVLSAAPVEVPGTWRKFVGWWSEERYGFDLSPLGVFASNALTLVHLSDDLHVAPPADVIRTDLTTCASSLVRGRVTYRTTRPATVHGFCIWFTATLGDGLTLTSREPYASHWSHAWLPLERPVHVARNTAIDLEIETDDGKSWIWKGTVGKEAFHQTSWLALPPAPGQPRM